MLEDLFEFIKIAGSMILIILFVFLLLFGVYVDGYVNAKHRYKHCYERYRSVKTGKD